MLGQRAEALRGGDRARSEEEMADARVEDVLRSIEYE